MEKDTAAAIKTLEDRITNAPQRKVELQTAKDKAENELQKARSKVDALTAQTGEGEARFEAAQREVRQTEVSLANAEAKTSQIEAEREYFNDAYHDHFLPLRDGVWSKMQEANLHVDIIVPLCAKFGFEESLTCGFPPAARNKPHMRGPFDVTVMKELEKGLLAHVDQLGEKHTKATNIEAEARKAATTARNAREATVQSKQKTSADLQVAEAEEKKMEEVLKEATKVLRDFPVWLQETNESCNYERTQLKALREGAIVAFQFLKDRLSHDGKPAPALKTSVAMTIIGMDYPQLQAKPVLEEGVKKAVRDDISSRLEVNAAAIAVALAAGSVKVVATVTGAVRVAERLAGLSSSMAKAIAAVPGIDSVTNGATITVTEPAITPEKVVKEVKSTPLPVATLAPQSKAEGAATTTTAAKILESGAAAPTLK